MSYTQAAAIVRGVYIVANREDIILHHHRPKVWVTPGLFFHESIDITLFLVVHSQNIGSPLVDTAESDVVDILEVT